MADLNLGTVFASIELRMDRLERNLAKATSDFDKFGDGIKRKSKDIEATMSSLGRTLSIGLTAPIAAFGAAALKASTDMDSLKRGLVAVAGSTQEAEKQMKRLKEVAKLPGLGMEEAVRGSVRLQAAGLSAKQAEGALKGFGNAIATIGGGRAELDGVSYALAQIAAKGKVYQEELRQIQERIPQITQVLKEAFGTARAEDIQKLNLSSSQFFDKMNEALAKQPQVIGGVKNAMENFSDASKQALAKVGDAILPLATAFLEKVTPAIESVANWFKNLDDTSKTTLGGISLALAVTGPVMLGFKTLSDALKNVRDLLTAIAGTPAYKALFGAGPGVGGPNIPDGLQRVGMAAGFMSANNSKSMDALQAFARGDLARGHELLGQITGSSAVQGKAQAIRNFTDRRTLRANNGKEWADATKATPGMLNLDEEFARRLKAMMDASGGKLSITDGFRTRKQQEDVYRRKPGLAARPGHSLHELGLAADMKGDLQWAGINARSFGLYQPMPEKEPWHFQMLGAGGRRRGLSGGGVYAKLLQDIEAAKALRKKLEDSLKLATTDAGRNSIGAQLQKLDEQERNLDTRLKSYDPDYRKQQAEQARRKQEQAQREANQIQEGLARLAQKRKDMDEKSFRVAVNLAKERNRIGEKAAAELKEQQLEERKLLSLFDFGGDSGDGKNFLFKFGEAMEATSQRESVDSAMRDFSRMEDFTRGLEGLQKRQADRQSLLQQGLDAIGEVGRLTWSTTTSTRNLLDEQRQKELQKSFRGTFAGGFMNDLGYELGGELFRGMEKAFGNNPLGRALARSLTRLFDRAMDGVIDSLATGLFKGKGGGLNAKGFLGKDPGLLGSLAGLVLGGGGLLGGVFGGLGKILKFDTGGIVPGPIGMAVPAILHAGETVLPTHRSPGMGGVNIHSGAIVINAAPGMDVQAVARAVSREIAQHSDYQSRVRRGSGGR